MRAVLALPSQFPNGEKMARAGIDTMFKASREVDQAKMDEYRKYMKVGVFVVPTWYHSMSEFNAMTEAEKVAWAKEFAKICSEEISRTSSPSYFQAGQTPVQCYLNADNEYQSSKFALEFLREFRRLRNLRILVWSLQSFQGGWMEPDLIQQINSDPNLKVCPFGYKNDMSEVDTCQSTINLIKQGVRWERITTYHSCRVPLKYGWDGIAYLEDWSQLL